MKIERRYQPMSKKNACILSGIVIILVGCVIGFIVTFNKSLNNDKGSDVPTEESQNKQSVSKPSIAFKDIKTTEDRIVERFDLVMNEKPQVFTLEYTFESDDYSASLTGRFGEYNLFYDSEDGTVTGRPMNVLDEFKKRTYTESYISSKFNVDNFKFIEGVDGKMYLMVLATTYNCFVGKTVELYIFDDNLNLVQGDVNYNGCQNDMAMTVMTHTVGYEGREEPSKSGYQDTFGVCDNEDYCYVSVKTEGNKINYLKVMEVNVFGDPDYGKMEEREYIISDSKLTYKVKNSFRIITAAGQAC